MLEWKKNQGSVMAEKKEGGNIPKNKKGLKEGKND